MARVTKSDLEKQLKQAKADLEEQVKNNQVMFLNSQEEIRKLNNERIGVHQPVHDRVVRELQFSREMAETYKKYYDDERLKVERLINEKKLLNKELNEYKLIIEKNTKIQKVKNERGAGRKRVYDDLLISQIRELRTEGYLIREIAEKVNLSVGTVHKLIKESTQLSISNQE